MDSSADAAALARQLHRLAVARATGIATLRAVGERCQLIVVHGSLIAAVGGGEAAGERAVCARLSEVLRWRAPRLTFQAHPGPVAPVANEPRAAMGELLLRAAELGASELSVRASTLLRLSPFGHALHEAGVALAPEMNMTWTRDLRVEQWLQAGASRARLSAALWLSALVPATAVASRSYGLMLRKQRQLGRTSNPHQLLELAPDADPAGAGKALRRLAAQLHPDALGPDAPPALRALSSELICALVRAERSLRAQSSRPRG